MKEIQTFEKWSLFHVLFLVTTGLSVAVDASFLSLFSSQSEPPDPCYDELGMTNKAIHLSHNSIELYSLCKLITTIGWRELL